MKRTNRVLAVLALTGPALAFAADSGHSPAPMQRAAESLNRNLDKQPENSGLQNAADRQRDNRLRFDSKHGTKATNPSSTTGSSTADQTARSPAVDQSERPESVPRPERVEKPERGERPGRPEMPDKPDKRL